MKQLCFDIGANRGLWALANIQRFDKIISVEASPITFQALQNTCNHERIMLLNFCVCNNNGEDITFYHADEDTLSTLNLNWLTSETSRFCNKSYKPIQCKTITIDRLIEQYGMPDQIKIDVEGGEYACLTSLTQKVNTVCFEWASETNDITFKCLDYLESLGYKKFFLQFEDAYTYEPNENEYVSLDVIKSILQRTVPKIHWGMMWAKIDA